MDRRLVLDIETKKTFDEVGGREHMHLLGVTVVGVYDYSSDSYTVYEEKDLGLLQNALINASLIIGFNHIGFDLPILQSYFSIDVKTLPVFDIMVDFYEKMGHRVGLDSIAKATLGVGKTGHGLDAIKFYREGRMQELKDYCLNDVKVTKDVFDFGIQNGKIHYLSKFGNQKKELEVDWKKFKKPPQQTNVEPAQYKLF
jgi:DEAD/DEAH box helicase domain-containing protein